MYQEPEDDMGNNPVMASHEIEKQKMIRESAKLRVWLVLRGLRKMAEMEVVGGSSTHYHYIDLIDAAFRDMEEL